jgi:hypothetical protein
MPRRDESKDGLNAGMKNRIILTDKFSRQYGNNLVQLSTVDRSCIDHSILWTLSLQGKLL